MNDFDERVKNYYNTVWEATTSYFKLIDYNMIGEVDINDKDVLNLGCGFPIDEIKYFNVVKSWTAIDFSEGIIDKCNEIFISDKLKFVFGDIRDMPFLDESFDVVLSFSTIDHVHDNRKKVHSEVRRVLRKNGFYLITVPNFLFFEVKEVTDFGYEYRYTPKELKDELEEEKFINIKFFFSGSTNNNFGEKIGYICQRDE